AAAAAGLDGTLLTPLTLRQLADLLPAQVPALRGAPLRTAPRRERGLRALCDRGCALSETKQQPQAPAPPPPAP
ncbi:hypothetical protein, partial [Methylobacterium radiotolerans]|uniref:hypothetical protein n=1 Tax=Methylobacterium radiotolerans TaxID=31998 RepID=UPI001AECD512